MPLSPAGTKRRNKITKAARQDRNEEEFVNDSGLAVDFCVVGGGPAGLTMALLLLRSGQSVALIERASSFDREYRGEILQPGGMAILDELGVLESARERGCYEHSRFQLVEKERILLDIDYRRMDTPFNCLLSIPQRHVLEELLVRCERYENFMPLIGSRASELIRDGDRISGVVCEGEQGRMAVRAHCVIAADGRFSKVRQLAGIGRNRLESFDHDVLWFKLKGTPVSDPRVQVYREEGGSPILSYLSYPDSLQLGWTLPHKSYPDLAGQGVGHLKEQLSRAVPRYADLIDEQITSLKDFSLLDVYSGSAQRWVQNGLILLGDAAHTHGPIGAQGINLAIQDAVLAHPVLLASRRAGAADVAFLDQFARSRQRDINSVMRLQKIQGRAMLSHGKMATTIRPRMAKALALTPLYGLVLNRLAFGRRKVRLSSDLFVDSR